MSETKQQVENTKPEYPKNNVRVSARRSNEAYVEVTKDLLAEGEATVEISGLGVAIAEAVAVVEELKFQGFVETKQVQTSRGAEDAKRANTEKITVTLVKSKDFDAKYKAEAPQREARKAEEAKLQAEKEARKAEREAARAAKLAEKEAAKKEKEAAEEKKEE